MAPRETDGGRGHGSRLARNSHFISSEHKGPIPWRHHLPTIRMFKQLRYIRQKWEIQRQTYVTVVGRRLRRARHN